MSQYPPPVPQQPQDGLPPQPQYVQPSPLPNAPGAVAALVCGIIGVSFGALGLILGPIAISQAGKAQDYLLQYRGYYTGESLATAGRILGIVATILGSISLLILIVQIVIIVTAMTA